MHDPSLLETIFIFTDSQTEHNECIGDYTDLALGDNARRFYSVILHCGAEENERRLVLPGRGSEAGNRKLTDVKVLRERRAREGIWKFEDDDEIEIDVTSTSAETAAQKIARFMEQREKDGRSETEWY